VRRPLTDRVLDRSNKRRPSWLMSEVLAAWRALPDVPEETTREVA
jgi:hypothetical protein